MSAYGNDTPITSSDEDDDLNHGHHHSGGGFTETNLDPHSHYDDTNATPLTDDEDPHDADHTDGDFWLQIHIDADTEPLVFPFAAYETLSDLRSKILARGDIALSDSHLFCIGVAEELEFEDEEVLRNKGLLLDDEQITLKNFAKQTLSIYWRSFALTIRDGLDFELTLRVSADFTIGMVKDAVERHPNGKRLQWLSLDGNEVIDSEALSFHGIDRAGYTLISRLSVQISDAKCGNVSDLLICSFWDLDKVLSVYLESERRERHASAYFEVSGKRMSLEERVFGCGIENGAVLTYSVGAYAVNVYDSVSALERESESGHGNEDMLCLSVQVFDHWTLSELKTAYAKLTKKPFMEKERFLSEERELEEDVPLWKLRIRDNEKLIIEREQAEVVVTYICCECGSEVQLRRYDSVQCRQCFHGAVYKQRTQRVCQYSCR